MEFKILTLVALKYKSGRFLVLFYRQIEQFMIQNRENESSGL